VITVRGDMRDPVRILPGRILADAELIALTDLAEPACVILSGVLRFADAGPPAAWPPRSPGRSCPAAT
jgi:hypothetical protein